MSIFDDMFIVKGWTVKSPARKLTAEESASIKSCSVVDTAHGAMIVFLLQRGEQGWAKLSKDTTLVVGDVVDVASITLTVLEQDGSEDITRYDGTPIVE